MEIFIKYQGQQTGPFSPQEIQSGLESGIYQPSDLVWYEGIEGWIPLSTASHILSGTPPLPSVTPAPPFGGQPVNSGLAIASMILGISAFFCGITALPAIICGHIAHGKIKQSQGRLTGSGFAIAGLITGYLGLIVFIAALAGLTAPMILRQRKMAEQTMATSNARQIGLALYQFQAEYDSFPNASTAPLVADATGNPEVTGSSANARFRQLFSSYATESEQMFYAKTSGSRIPDGDISGSNALSPGECGFGYIENVPAHDATPRPIAMTPFKPGSSQFDPDPFSGMAVILWSDSSVRSLPIDRATGEAILDGQNLLDPSHPVWGSTPPSLLLPE